MIVRKSLESLCETQPGTSELTKERRNCFLVVWLLVKGESMEVEASVSSYVGVRIFMLSVAFQVIHMLLFNLGRESGV